MQLSLPCPPPFALYRFQRSKAENKKRHTCYGDLWGVAKRNEVSACGKRHCGKNYEHSFEGNGLQGINLYIFISFYINLVHDML